jgi:hypothetical protein
MTTSTARPAADATTDPRVVYARTQYQLFRRFWLAETTHIKEAAGDLSSGLDVSDEDKQMVQEVNVLVARLLLDLVARRLTRNDRTRPLLRVLDARFLASEAVRGMEAEDPESTTSALEVTTLLSYVEPLASAHIQEHLAALSAFTAQGSTDLYAGFWRVVSALVSTSITGPLPDDMYDNSVFRAAILQSTSSLRSWTRACDLLAALSTQVGSGELLQGLSGVAGDEDAVHEAMVELEAKLAPAALDQVKALKRLFRARARDIWPTRS